MTVEEIRERIDTIERAYEFFLAFAAQGVRDDRSSPTSGQLRDMLKGLSEALDGLGAGVRARVEEDGRTPSDGWSMGVEVLERDATSARALVEMVRGRESISSQLIDNLNASVHVRALLTDLFLIDELIET